MILLTLGTHDQPFTRALEIVAPLAGTDRLVVQHGHTPPLAGLDADWRPFVRREEMAQLMGDASAVVCHAGVGCIVTALSLGRRPVVIPRRAARGEHVDDHQLQIAEEMDGAGMIAMYREGEDIHDALARAVASSGRLGDGARLRRAVEQATRPAGAARAGAYA